MREKKGCLGSLTALLAIQVFTANGDDLSTVQLDRPIRMTTNGPVRGYWYVDDNKTMAEIYEGIPYAQPPIGQKRFEMPDSRMDNWIEPLDCGRDRMSWCVQFWYNDRRRKMTKNTKRRADEEDCLHLRILIPSSIKKNNTLLPVLVWIHGGSYQVNGANMYPVEGTVKNLVSKGIIFIAINYRLGPLGFLSSLHPELPGNYGLEDQLVALQWIHSNVKYFGGDPKKITVGGESAGAASASLLAVSPRAQGLFGQMILRSGSSLSPWAVRSQNTDLNSLQLIRWSGCGDQLSLLNNGMERVKQCIKAIPISRLVNIWQNIANQDLLYVISSKKHSPNNWNHPLLAHTYFTPVVDAFRGNASLIPEYPRQMISINARMPIMIGVTNGECANYVMWLHFLASMKTGSQLSNIDWMDLEFVVPSVLYANSDQVKQAVYQQYIGNNLWNNNDFNIGKALVSIASDQNFVSPVVQEAKIYAQRNNTVYTYIFEYENDQLTSRARQQGLLNVGAGHGHDMVYLFESRSVLDVGGEEKAMNWTDDDRIISDALSSSMVNFIAYGIPGLSLWPKFESPSFNAYVHGNGNVSSSIRDFFNSIDQFWHSAIPLIESLNLLRPPDIIQGPCPDCQQHFKAPFFIVLIVTFLVWFFPVNLFISIIYSYLILP